MSRMMKPSNAEAATNAQPAISHILSMVPFDHDSRSSRCWRDEVIFNLVPEEMIFERCEMGVAYSPTPTLAEVGRSSYERTNPYLTITHFPFRSSSAILSCSTLPSSA